MRASGTGTIIASAGNFCQEWFELSGLISAADHQAPLKPVWWMSTPGPYRRIAHLLVGDRPWPPRVPRVATVEDIGILFPTPANRATRGQQWPRVWLHGHDRQNRRQGGDTRSHAIRKRNIGPTVPPCWAHPGMTGRIAAKTPAHDPTLPENAAPFRPPKS